MEKIKILLTAEQIEKLGDELFKQGVYLDYEEFYAFKNGDYFSDCCQIYASGENPFSILVELPKYSKEKGFYSISLICSNFHITSNLKMIKEILIENCKEQEN